ITLQEEYVAICGYTQEELESNFSEHIDAAAEYQKMTREEVLEHIRYWYNGYTWDGKTAIYNPFSTMKFFKIKRFKDYWFSSGTPTFLMDIIQRRNRADAVLEPVVVDENIFDGYDPANIGEVPLLFQTGYLTIKKMELIGGRARYTLDVPNMEVKEALMEHLFSAYSENNVATIQSMIPKIQSQIYEGKTSALEESLRSLLAHIPNNLHAENESYYHSLFLFLMATLGFDIQGEVLTNIGRIDAVWRQPGLTVVAEIKYSAEKKIDNLLNAAMRQIRNRKYYEAYLNDTKVMLMAIAFAGKEIKCRMEKINYK
ncbi:MAG: ATP-binding protein, partial [Prevotellaceae bacterium]|nr:ATP-binding protein [Prevotellaceae bacterium]